MLWRCTGEGQEGLLRIEDILQCPAPKQGVLAIGRKMVVQAKDEGVVVEFDRSCETVSGVVETITHSGFGGNEIAKGRLEVIVEEGGVDPLDPLRTAGIKLADLVWSECVVSRLVGVALTAHTQHISTVGACRCIRTLVLDHTIEERWGGDVSYNAGRFASPGALVIGKEEGAISFYRAAYRQAENVPDELWWYFQEIITGAGVRVAMISICGSVDGGWAALGGQSKFGAWTNSPGPRGVGCGHAEFLNGIQR